MLLQPASNEDLQSVYRSLTAGLQRMQAKVDMLTNAVSMSNDTLANAVRELSELKTVIFNNAIHMTTGHTTHSTSSTTPLTIWIPPRSAHTPTTVPTAASILPAATSTTIHLPTQLRALAPYPSTASNGTLPRVAEANSTMASAEHARSLSSSQQLPTARLVIPNVSVILPDGT